MRRALLGQRGAALLLRVDERPQRHAALLGVVQVVPLALGWALRSLSARSGAMTVGTFLAALHAARLVVEALLIPSAPTTLGVRANVMFFALLLALVAAVAGIALCLFKLPATHAARTRVDPHHP